MQKVTFIGDVHGLLDRYKRMLLRFTEPTLQIGDMGIGFRKGGSWITTGEMNPKDKFFDGNHDCAKECLKEQGYAGRFGITKEGVFFVAGAFSPDAFYRTIGIDWWPSEELSQQEFDEALQLYLDTKPDIVATHDCPFSLVQTMLNQIGKPDGPVYMNRTGLFHDKLLEIHKPKIWIFGHWHKSVDITIDGVRFICLNELEPLTLEF